MTATATSSTLLHTASGAYLLPERHRQEVIDRFFRRAALKAFRAVGLAAPRIAEYTAPAVPWLPAVERRIRDSIAPVEYPPAAKPGEWLPEPVGVAAIDFFRLCADLLPGEPYIYATEYGNLIAEFGTGVGAMTVAVRPDSAIVFAVSPAEQQPIQLVLKRGDARARDELEAVRRRMRAGSHGEVDTRQ